MRPLRVAFQRMRDCVAAAANGVRTAAVHRGKADIVGALACGGKRERAGREKFTDCNYG